MAHDLPELTLAALDALCDDALPLGELLAAVHAELGRLMANDNLYVALYDPESALYSFPFSTDEEDDDFTPQQLEKSLTDYVRRTGSPLLCDSETHEALIAAGEVRYVGGYSPIWLGVPVRSDSGVIGVAVVQSYTDGERFSAADIAPMQAVFAAVGPAIEDAWARENRAAARRLKVRQLEASRDEALRVSAAKSSFLANMSHELRTPLNAIIGYSELLLEDLDLDGKVERPDELRHIATAAQHLLQIVNDILDLSRVEAGKEEAVAESFQLRELAASVEAMAQPLARSRDVRFRLVCIEDLALCTDRQKLAQVVMNLVGNACRFAAGCKVVVRMDPITVPEDERPWVRIDVADTGPGIDPSQLERLFEPFEQADNRTTRTAGGTGLGLAISRRYGRLLGGDLIARSIPGRGSSFQLVVPAVLGASG